MSSSMQDCVRRLGRNRDVEELLPEYIRQSMIVHRDYARLKLMIEYYVFYEIVQEGINPYIDSAADIAQKLHQVIDQVFSGTDRISEAEAGRLKGILAELRGEVTDRMQVLTAYVDRFVIYEYILNRVQYRFADQEMMPSDADFTQDVVNFLFSTKDTMTINQNIRLVLGQLPVRMTRKHYFDLIRDSISVYKGSDTSSLEEYIYMFRTSAMLYETEDMEKFLTEFIPVLQEFEALDYETLDAAAYAVYEEKLRVNSSKLNDISDLYMLIQRLINALYSVVAAEPYCTGDGSNMAADTVIQGINDLFLHRDSGVWSNMGEDRPETDEEKLYSLGRYFTQIEGQQEQAYESITMADAILQETMEVQKEKIDALGIAVQFGVLKQLMKLCSGSDFVALEEEAQEDKVTEQQAEEAAGKLITELKDAFARQSRIVRRAVMANTLEKMPVFFTSAQEVVDYVCQSLAQCEDEAEKYASKLLIQGLMSED